jgi:ribonuclease G
MAATRNIIINAKHNVMRAAVIEDRNLDNLFIEKEEKSSIIGNIYYGHIEKILPSIQAAFVNIGIGKNGFLHSSDIDVTEKDSKKALLSIEKKLKEGQGILVQVAKDEIGTKGVRLVADISLPGRFLVLKPYGSGKIHLSRKIPTEEQRNYIKGNVVPNLPVPKDMDIIVRTVAGGVKPRFLLKDLDNLVNTWKDIQKEKENGEEIRCIHEELDLVRKIVRDWLTDDVESIYIDDTHFHEKLKLFLKNDLASPNVKLRLFRGDIDIFDKFGITRQIEKLYSRKVWLKCGGYLIIDKTEALVAIDVNTGRNIQHSNSDDTILETNLQAASEIARQLRLRNMGGIVVIDFIDMKIRTHQRQVLKRLHIALEKDKAKTKIFPFSKLGLVEMTRQRVDDSWEQHFFMDCDRCAGTGRILAIPVIADQVTSKIKRFLVLHPGLHVNVRAHPDVLDHMLANDTFNDIEKKFGTEIGYLKDESFHPEKYVVIRTDTGMNIIRYDT